MAGRRLVPLVVMRSASGFGSQPLRRSHPEFNRWCQRQLGAKNSARLSSISLTTFSRMGPKFTNPKRPTPVKAKADALARTKTVIVPRVPQEIVDEILDDLAADSDLVSLRSCALVSKSWVPSCQRHLFHTIQFTPGATFGWSKTFRVPEESPARYVRDLRVSSDASVDRSFFDHTPWFTNVERVTLFGYGLWILPFWRLPESITSLTVKTNTSNLVQVRDIMVQLPNLDDLSLSGDSVPVDRAGLVGIGTVLKGRFGGQLRLMEGYARADAVNMLLEVPTGLRFTEVEVRGRNENILSTMALAEACGKTLVKLSYHAFFDCRSHPFSWSSGF